MDAQTTNALTIAVATLNAINESLCLFNPWIVTMYRPPVDSPISSLVYSPALIITIAYAVLEPLMTWSLMRWPLEPWLTLLAMSPIHLAWGFPSFDTFDILLGKSQRESLPTETKETVGGSLQRSDEDLSVRTKAALVLLPSVFTASTINSAMLLFGQSLQAPSASITESPLYYLGVTAVAIFVVCRFPDYLIYRRLEQIRSMFKREGRKSLRAGINCLLILHGLRAFARAIAGIDLLVAIRQLSPSDAERQWGAERYVWLHGILGNRVSGLWQGVLLGLCSGVIMHVAGQYMSRTFSE